MLVTGLVAYWLHRKVVFALTQQFKDDLSEIVGVLNDDPRYTVKVRTVHFNHPELGPTPYDHELQEKFDNIIKQNFSYKLKKQKNCAPRADHKENPQ
jgi:hypothetical protein